MTQPEIDSKEGRKEELEKMEKQEKQEKLEKQEEVVEKQEGKEGVEKDEERENLLQRIKTRFSKRSKKANSEGTEVIGEEGKPVKNGQPEAKVIISMKEESKDLNNELTTEEQKADEKNIKESESADKKNDVMRRLKTRLSFREKKDKKEKVVDEGTQGVPQKVLMDNGLEKEKDVSVKNEETKKAKTKKRKKEKVVGKVNDDVKETDNDLSKEKIICTKADKKEKEEGKKDKVTKKNKSGNQMEDIDSKEKAKHEHLDVCADEKEKKKTENLFLRTLRRLSLRKKKGKGELEESAKDSDDKSYDQKATEDSVPEAEEEPGEVPPTGKARPQSMVVAGCRPPPGPGGGRPPIPRGRSTPSSATTQQNRTVSDLDSALRCSATKQSADSGINSGKSAVVVWKNLP